MAKRKTQAPVAVPAPVLEPIWYRTNFGKGPGAHVRSMESLVAVADRAALIALLPEGATFLELRPYGLDSRIGWQTHLVRATLGDGSIATVGFTSGPV